MVGRTPEYLGKKIPADRDEYRRRCLLPALPVTILTAAGLSSP